MKKYKRQLADYWGTDEFDEDFEEVEIPQRDKDYNEYVNREVQAMNNE